MSNSIQDKLQELNQKYQNFIDNVGPENIYMIDHLINQIAVCNLELSRVPAGYYYYNDPRFYQRAQNYQNQYYFPQPVPQPRQFFPSTPPRSSHSHQHFSGPQSSQSSGNNTNGGLNTNNVNGFQNNGNGRTNNGNIRNTLNSSNNLRRPQQIPLSYFGQIFDEIGTSIPEDNEDNLSHNVIREEYTDSNGNRVSFQQFGTINGGGASLPNLLNLFGGNGMGISVNNEIGFGRLGIDSLNGFQNMVQNMLQQYQQHTNLEDHPVPLPEEILNEMKVLKYSIQKYSNEFNTSCPICQEEFKENESIRDLLCNHLYHQDCIDEWFSENVSCPVCRKDMRDLVDFSSD